MKLVTFQIATPLGRVERIGAFQDDESILDLNFAYASLVSNEGRTGRAYEIAGALIPQDMIQFLEGGELSREAAERALEYARVQRGAVVGPGGEQVIHDLTEVKLLAPVPRPNSIRDTLSFEGHMKNFERRTGCPVPRIWYKRPIYYKGNCSSVVGPDAEIEWPDYTEAFDYELEFGIYIGRRGRNIQENDAYNYIAGYTIYNDFSARDIIRDEVSTFLGPAKAKDMDTGNAMGPFLVTRDEVDLGDLRMTASVNGEVWSTGNTGDMFWSFPRIIAHISRFETLYPGDFIGSGTVAYGCGDELDRWLQPNDVVELAIDGMGVLKNRVVRRQTSK